MNWTGGRLSRHSRNTKGSLTQRQKQYFAKVRNNSLNGGQKGSPIKWSFFEQDQNVPQHNLPDPSAAASLSSKQASNQPGRSLYDNTRKRVKQRDEARPKSPATAATQQKHPSPPKVRLLHNEYDLNHQPFDSHEETLMLPQVSKRRRHASLVQVEVAVLTQVPEEEESLEDRRRKILNKSDWVGADLQRPLKLKYTALTADGKIGKRRRIDPDENIFGATLQAVVSSPFEAPKQKSMTREAALTYPYRDEIQSGWIPESRNHARISIGGKHKLVRATSSIRHRLTQRDQFMSSQASTSDAMLLDDEDTSRWYNTQSRGKEGQYSDPLLPPLLDPKATRVHNPQTKISQKIPGPRYGEWPPDRQKIFSSKIHSEVNVSLSTARTSARNRHRHGESQVAKQDHCLPDSSNYEASPGKMCHEDSRRLEVSTLPHFTLAKLRSLDVQRFEDVANLQDLVGRETGHHRTYDRPPSSQGDCMTSLSEQFSNSARKLQSVAWDKARNLSHFSSGPQLLHPIPQSSRKLPVLRTTSPRDADSVIAQLGAARPVVPLSQLLDDEVWKTWILSSDTKDKEDEFELHGVDKVLFSPGISTIAHQLDQDSLLQRTVAREKTLAATNKEDYGNRFGHETELEEGNYDREKTSSIDILQDKREIHLPGAALTTLPALDYKKTFFLRSKPARSPPKAVLQPNPEEAWMKFILGDNIDREDDGSAITAPRPQKTLIELPTLSPPESSLLAHPSTEATSNTHLNSSHFNIHSSPSAPEATVGSTATPVHNTRVSNHSIRGSNTSSSSDPISRSLSHISKRHFLFSSGLGPPSNLRTTHKVLFNKPPRYTTRGRRTSCSPDELADGKDDVLHIGRNRKALGKEARKYTAKGRKGHRKKDIYSLSSSDDDVESIEDI
jgi:hypothetical protein